MKLYNRKEVSAILKKATENSSTNDSDTSIGISVSELQQIASEVGIDPEQIASAATEIDATYEKNEQTFWGGPFSFSSQVLADNEITDGQWEEMLISIREFFQSKGEVTSRKSVFEWSSPWDTTNSARVTALKADGKTKIIVNWNGPLTAIPFYIPVPVAAIVSMLLASGFFELASVPGIAFSMLATGLTFLAGRWALRRHLNKGFKKLRQLVARLNIIASVKSRDSENHSSRIDADQTQANTSNPLSQIEIPEEKNNDNPDKETAKRNRSRT